MKNKAQKTIDQANTHNNNNRTDKNLCSLPIYQKTTHPGQVPKRQRTKQAMTHTHTKHKNTQWPLDFTCLTVISKRKQTAHTAPAPNPERKI